MNMMIRIRIYHAVLASLSLFAYLTGEFGFIHVWLGYGVLTVILFRLLWALIGNRQLGLTRFQPSFEGLKLSNLFTHPAVSKVLILGVALSLIAAASSGIALDQSKAIGDDGNGFLQGTHEVFANIWLLFIGMHASYLLLFKTPLARFMLFIPKQQHAGSDKDKTNVNAFRADAD